MNDIFESGVLDHGNLVDDILFVEELSRVVADDFKEGGVLYEEAMD
jgi:hypothetical protein